MSQGTSSPRHTFAQGGNAAYLEGLYQDFRKDPASVDPTWRSFFEGMEFGATSMSTGDGVSAEEARDNAKVEALINAYRRLGHLSAHLNPLAPKPAIHEDMRPEFHGLGHVTPDQMFHPANLPSREPMNFGAIMDLLTSTYCNRIGADYREINDIEIVTWLQGQMESCRNQPVFAREVRRRVLEKLTEAEGFEKFLQSRYLGQKRFSLEGAEALIPMLDVLIDDASAASVQETCIGMAHRGRLNVLANFMGKSFEKMLREFEGSEYNPFDIDGDVKYHMGFASEVATLSGNSMRLYLSPNPSHLEVVNPVVEGFARARQRLQRDYDRSQVMPLLIHGDASFIGQGIVAETLNLSQLAYYTTGGTIHIIINNQIGFTTNPEDSRSCTYSSDIAKMVRAPVLHVNADDPEAVIWTARLAVAYRQKFHRDIVIDLVGYRRHGHNETDEPQYTQPTMYKTIANHPSALALYQERLKGDGVVSEEEANQMSTGFRSKLQAAFEAVRAGATQDKGVTVPVPFQKSMAYRKVEGPEVFTAVKTNVASGVLKDVAQKITSIPADFKVHPKLVKLVDARRAMVEGEGAIDWAFAELLAFATLAKEGHHVRLSGQDCRRGTFSSRHGVLFDFEDGRALESLNQMGEGQQPVDIINSSLSEAGVLGFEFGYSVADPDALVLWEAQFGDFVNGAQIIIDQFMVASEAKWKQVCSLVLLLPHGYEGQGPEHSSARPERFLQLCGNLNIQVAIPTTSAQYFHLLRRQAMRPFRKPLVVMTPKSLLRHPKVVSSMNDFTDQIFQELIDDVTIKDPQQVQRIVLCTGKVFYDLSEEREKHKDLAHVPIVRVEQLYPFPEEALKQLLARYPQVKQIVWAQEEPQNMGAWTFVQPRLLELLPTRNMLQYVGRKSSGTTAEGSSKAHVQEQARIVRDSLGLNSTTADKSATKVKSSASAK